jgi:5-methylcytosine-specific restriction endonuclease McrA
MNWNNHVKYYLNKWNDNDPSTWTWQIDHIIPQSKLLYTNMEDENFNKCWDLNNLRPISSKENLKKGNKILS